MADNFKISLYSILYGLLLSLDIKTIIPLISLCLSWFIFGYIGIYQLILSPIHQQFVVEASSIQIASGLILFLLSALSLAYSVEFSLLIDKFPSANMHDLFMVSIRNYFNFMVSFFIQLIITILSFVVFIIPSLIIGPLNFFNSALSIKENTDPFSAIKRSYALSRSHFWTTFSVFFVYLMIGIFILYIIYTNIYSDFIVLVVLIIVPYLSIAFFVSSYRLLEELTKIEKVESSKYHFIFRPE